MPVDRRRRRSPTARCGSAATRSGREWFAGRIDELRVYDRALHGAEVAVDMTRPITCVSDPARAGARGHARRAWPSRPSRAARRRRPRRSTIANTGGGTLQLDRVRRRARGSTVSPAARHRRRHASPSRRDDRGLRRRARYTGERHHQRARRDRRAAVVPVTLTVDRAAAAGARPSPRHRWRSAARRAARARRPRRSTVANTGGGTLTWTRLRRRRLARASPRPSGTDAGTITVTPSIGGLTAGHLHGRPSPSRAAARAARRGRSRSRFTVDPPPRRRRSPSRRRRWPSARPRARRRSRRRRSTSPTPAAARSTFTATADVPWLSVSPPSGQRSAHRLGHAVHRGPGRRASYTGTVTIAAAGVSGSPKTVAVTFTVTAAPACRARPDSSAPGASTRRAGTTVADASAGRQHRDDHPARRAPPSGASAAR